MTIEDPYAGQGGRYIVDPATGARRQIEPPTASVGPVETDLPLPPDPDAAVSAAPSDPLPTASLDSAASPRKAR